jgi:uncharacterized membrane protein YhhN
MRLSTNPSVWRVALLAVVAAGAQVGLLTPAVGDQLDGGITAVAEALTILLPVAGAIWSKSRTAPVAAGTPAAKMLIRDSEGVYQAAGTQTVNLNDTPQTGTNWPDRT